MHTLNCHRVQNLPQCIISMHYIWHTLYICIYVLYVFICKHFCFSYLGRIKYLTMTDSRKVWMPDTFFRNEKHGQFHRIIQPNLYIRVFPEGDILYSIRWILNNKHILSTTCDSVDNLKRNFDFETMFFHQMISKMIFTFLKIVCIHYKIRVCLNYHISHSSLPILPYDICHSQNIF